jgi:hypothetical protein
MLKRQEKTKPQSQLGASTPFVGIWSFFGAWNLAFGVSARRSENLICWPRVFRFSRG